MRGIKEIVIALVLLAGVASTAQAGTSLFSWKNFTVFSASQGSDFNAEKWMMDQEQH